MVGSFVLLIMEKRIKSKYVKVDPMKGIVSEPKVSFWCSFFQAWVYFKCDCLDVGFDR